MAGRPKKTPEAEKTPRKPKAERVKDEVTAFTDRLYEVIKKRDSKAPIYSALRKKVNDLVSDVKDLDQIELVCMTIIDDTHDFASWRDFSWGHFEYTRDSLEVPDGAWKYALWAYNCKDKKLQDSINYWLGAWYDADLDGNVKGIALAQQGIEKLWMKHHQVEEVGW